MVAAKTRQDTEHHQTPPNHHQKPHLIMAVTKSWCRLESVGKPFLLVRNTLVGTMTAFTGSPTHRSRMLWAGRSAVTSSTTDKLRTCLKPNPRGGGVEKGAVRLSLKLGETLRRACGLCTLIGRYKHRYLRKSRHGGGGGAVYFSSLHRSTDGPTAARRQRQRQRQRRSGRQRKGAAQGKGRQGKGRQEGVAHAARIFAALDAFSSKQPLFFRVRFSSGLFLVKHAQDPLA